VNQMGLSARQEAARDSLDVYLEFEYHRYDDIKEKWPIVKQLTTNILSTFPLLSF
jgi:hypothetical protein